MNSISIGPSSDHEVGYRCLEYEPEDPHLQDGIILYNHDEAIATEAILCARRLVGCDGACAGAGEARPEDGWKPTYKDFLDSRSRHFACVTSILNGIIPLVSRESVNGLVLDYEPWMRSIDRSDMMYEAASQKEAEARTGLRGGRTTRNSQRAQYQRYFELDSEERRRWEMSGLMVDCVEDTLCGGNESQTSREDP